MKNFEGMLSRTPSLSFEPYVDPAPVDHTDPESVADCLLETSPDLEVYTLFDQYDADYVRSMALELAEGIIGRRNRLETERRAALAAAAVENTVELHPPTIYVVTATPLPAAS